MCLATPEPDTTAQFVEFYHAGLDHYFYTGHAGEIAAIDADKVGAGWARPDFAGTTSLTSANRKRSPHKNSG